MDTFAYIRDERFLSSDIGDELMLYDSRRKTLEVLNGTARTIWNFCTRPRTPEQIADHLTSVFRGVESEAAVRDVLEFLSSHERLFQKTVVEGEKSATGGKTDGTRSGQSPDIS